MPKDNRRPKPAGSNNLATAVSRKAHSPKRNQKQRQTGWQRDRSKASGLISEVGSGRPVGGKLTAGEILQKTQLLLAGFESGSLATEKFKIFGTPLRLSKFC